MRNVKSYLAIGAAMVATVGGTYFAATVNAQAPVHAAARTTTAQVAKSTQQSNPHPTRVEGKISAIGSNSITLTTKNGSITANVGASTWIVVNQDKKAAQGALADLKTNEAATVAGMTTADATVIDARVITQGVQASKIAPGAVKAAKKAAVGVGKLVATQEYTVTATTSTSLTVATAKGKTFTVAVSPSTVVLNNGFSTPGTIQVNSKVQIFGLPERMNKKAPASTGNVALNAWAIRVVNTGSELRVAHVTAVNGNTLTVKTGREPNGLTVNLGTATAYRSLSTAATKGQVTLGTAAQGDIKAGSNLLVEGTLSTDGKSLTADAVIIAPSRAAKTTKPAPATTPTTKP